MSSFIPIKKIQKRSATGEAETWFAVPAMAISSPQGRLLIPNPAGAEAQLFATLEEAEEAVRRAGFDYEFEGKQVFAFQSGAATKSAAVARPGAAPMEQAVPLLIEHLKDRESSVVANAAYALGTLKAGAALEPLSQILGHDDPTVRKNVAEAMARLGPAALTHLSLAFEKARTNPGKQAPYIRLTVLSAFLEMVEQGQVGACSGHYLPLAVIALQDDSWLVRSQAALLVGKTAQALEEERRRLEQTRPGR
jgi:HEAT repeat protein